MQRGDLVRLKKISESILGHNGKSVIFSDEHFRRLKVLVEGDMYSFYLKDKRQTMLQFGDVAIVLDNKTIFKNNEIWNSFVKVITSNGDVGWISKEHLVVISIY